MNRRIYLDNNASTPVAPQVVEVMQQALLTLTGNPSSVHAFGQKVRNELSKARRSLAEFFDVRPSEIIFTSGGTESMNFLIKGLSSQYESGHLITSDVEHSCVHTTVGELEGKGWCVTFLPAGAMGAVSPEAVARAIQPDTRFIAIMAANNETGVLTDLQAIAQIAESRRIPLLVDGVALLGKESFALPSGVTGIGFSGHKIHAPQGIGFVILRNHLEIAPLLTGGGQEGMRRGGTENVVGILALAEAIRLLQKDLPESVERMRGLRDLLEKELQERLEGVVVHGKGARVSNTTSLSFLGVDGESLLMNLDLAGIAVSHGAACSSGALEPSRVFLQMGSSAKLARSAIRISLSRLTTREEIDEAIEAIVTIVRQLRAMHPLEGQEDENRLSSHPLPPSPELVSS